MLSFIFWIALLLSPIFFAGVIFLIQGPPYVASDDESAREIVKLVKRYKPKRILDMGSGDGKLVILLAREGYKVDGIEFNPRLVYRSRKVIKREKLEKKAKIVWGNFWALDTSKYDLIILYAIKHVMPRLEKKLTKELKPHSYIISNYFVFPNLKPINKPRRVKLYQIK